MSEIVDPKASDTRRNWGLALLAGGGMAMTGYAAAALWVLYDRKGSLDHVFYLGLAALGLVGIVLTGFAGLLVKRTLRLGKDGLEVSDQADAPGDGL